MEGYLDLAKEYAWLWTTVIVIVTLLYTFLGKLAEKSEGPEPNVQVKKKKKIVKIYKTRSKD